MTEEKNNLSQAWQMKKSNSSSCEKAKRSNEEEKKTLKEDWLWQHGSWQQKIRKKKGKGRRLAEQGMAGMKIMKKLLSNENQNNGGWHVNMKSNKPL